MWMTLSVRAPAIDQPQELLSVVVHELRSPVASVMGVLDLIADPAVGLESAEVEELVSGAGPMPTICSPPSRRSEN